MDALNLQDEHYAVALHLMVHVTPLLNRVSQGIPEYTDHGIIHTINVLSNVRDIITEYPIPKPFTDEERFVLTLAAVVHDIGCISGREEHSEKTVTILKKPQFNFLREDIGDLYFRALTNVIKWHCKKFDLEKIGPDPCNQIRLKAIASLFRLADACDMSGERIKRLVMEILLEEKKLPPDSEAIWKAHLQVEKVLINKTDIQPQVYDLEKADYCIKELEKELFGINTSLTNLHLPIFMIKPVVIDPEITEDVM